MKDRQPKHRQAARERARLDRWAASRAGLPTALIVCEGRCTETHYLRGLIEHLGVNAANAHIQPGSYETDARSLVQDAQARFRKNPEYDRVFVVLDGDQAHLAEARRDGATAMANAGGGRSQSGQGRSGDCRCWRNIAPNRHASVGCSTSGDEPTPPGLTNSSTSHRRRHVTFPSRPLTSETGRHADANSPCRVQGTPDVQTSDKQCRRLLSCCRSTSTCQLRNVDAVDAPWGSPYLSSSYQFLTN
jgi:hypothetical protein